MPIAQYLIVQFCIQLLLVFIGVFPEYRGTFIEFRESENQWSMNWAQFKDPVSHTPLAGTAIASGLLHKKWLSGQFEPFYCKDKYFCHQILWNNQNTTNIFS